jgi:hypothetical protein
LPIIIIITVVVAAAVVPTSTHLNRTGKRVSLHKGKCISYRLDVAFDIKSKQSGKRHELSPYKTIFSEKLCEGSKQPLFLLSKATQGKTVMG